MSDMWKGYLLALVVMFASIVLQGYFMMRKDVDIEKSGVWTNGDRAYKLVRIEK